MIGLALLLFLALLGVQLVCHTVRAVSDRTGLYRYRVRVRAGEREVRL